MAKERATENKSVTIDARLETETSKTPNDRSARGPRGAVLRASSWGARTHRCEGGEKGTVESDGNIRSRTAREREREREEREKWSHWREMS